MENLEIRDVNLKNIDHLVNLCISPDRRNDPLFVKGINMKKRWASKVIREYGSVANLAYLNQKPAGLIRYKPVPEQRLVEIDCIFVPEKGILGKE
jgi:hypothetical protein